MKKKMSYVEDISHAGVDVLICLYWGFSRYSMSADEAESTT